MKALVLGGAGFIGYHLCKRLLNDGHEVFCVDNFSRGKEDEDFEELKNKYYSNLISIKLDLSSREIVNGNFGMIMFEDIFIDINDIDIILHLSAINGTKNFYEKSCEVLEVNTLSLINILNFLRDKEYKGKMIWMSSSEVYAGIDCPYPTPEVTNVAIEDVYNPRWSYAGSKILGELLCINYARQYYLDINIVRPHNIYGPRMGYDHVIPEFIIRALKKENPFKIYGKPGATRAFCYIDDFIDGLIILSKINKTDDMIFNIGDYKNSVTIHRLAKMITGEMGYSPSIDILDSPEGSTSRRCPDITKMCGLGYKPNTSLDKGLYKTIEWYRRNYEEKTLR